MSDLLQLHKKPILRPLEKYFGKKIENVADKVDAIITICKELQREDRYYFPLCGKERLKLNTEKFIKFLKQKYKTERGEIFTHPYHFNVLGGDCDCQTIYCLSHLKWLGKEFQSPVEILILKNTENGRNFFHITQSFNGKIIDFLPYKIPLGTKVIYKKLYQL